MILDGMETKTLIITDMKEQEIIGSVSFVKRALSQLHEDIRYLIPLEKLSQEHVWECSDLHRAFLQEPSCISPLSENCYHFFYRSLYDGMVDFGRQNGVGFILVKFTADAYLATKAIGLWPYIIEFAPQEFSDEFFYGILPLKGEFYKEYQEKWEKLDASQS